MQKTFNTFLEWSNCLQIEVAPHKSAILSLNSFITAKYSLDHTNLPICLSYKDLCISFDKEMYFIKHISEYCRIDYATINSLFRCFLICDQYTNKSLSNIC